MHHHYEDIRHRIIDQPLWFDECAVPRYCEFAPDEMANIYASEVALVHIKCQNCDEDFHVAFSDNTFDRKWRDEVRVWEIAESIVDGSLHYGDPPNTGCCAAGPTMNCNDIRVLEYWRKGDDFEWERIGSLELPLPDHPDYAPEAGRGDSDGGEDVASSKR